MNLNVDYARQLSKEATFRKQCHVQFRPAIDWRVNFASEHARSFVEKEHVVDRLPHLKQRVTYACCSCLQIGQDFVDEWPCCLSLRVHLSEKLVKVVLKLL